MHKSFRTANAAICLALLALFFYLGHIILYPSAGSFEKWLSLTFLTAVLLGTQSLIHLFIGRMQLQNPLAWQIFGAFACVLMWMYLFLYSINPVSSAQEIMLHMLKFFAGLLVVHGIVLGDHLLTKHLISENKPLSVDNAQK